ncbi:MAG: hypothetical protein ACREIT_04580 [Tepidisphaeraceae bacterium]
MKQNEPHPRSASARWAGPVVALLVIALGLGIHFYLEARRLRARAERASEAHPLSPEVLARVDAMFALTTTAPARDAPRFVDNVVYVQCLDPGGGCTSAPPAGRSIVDGALTCGHPGKVSRVSWEFVQASDAGDVYRFTRVYPLDDPTATTQTREATYAGADLVVFEDAVYRIGMRPTDVVD